MSSERQVQSGVVRQQLTIPPGTGNGEPRQMRSDIASMLLPFFPEDRGLTTFTTTIDGYGVSISSDEGHTIATTADRKILNFLAAAIARSIRNGFPPSRHIEVEMRPMLAALSLDSSAVGGSDYQRIRERLARLMATVIETDMPIGDRLRRRRRFRWIDAFEHDDKLTPGGRKILAIRISLSEDAFHWLTTSLGFDLCPREFQTITSARNSVWRIYEICLAWLAQADTRTIVIPIAELRDRVPIASALKVFKNRTLRNALDAIRDTPEMAVRIAARLERKTENGFKPVDFSTRVPLGLLYVRVGPGTGALPRLNRLLPDRTAKAVTTTDDFAPSLAQADESWEAEAML